MPFINLEDDRNRKDANMLFIAALPLALHFAAPPLHRAPPVVMAQPQKNSLLDNALINRVKRLLGRGEPKNIVCGDTKYGCDPRGPDWFLDDDYTVPVPVNDTFAMPVPGEVGVLTGGVAHLSAVLQAAGDERAVVLKFKREGCPACNSTIAPLASAAQAYAGRADFLEVDYNLNKRFCRQCALAVVPSAHVYVGGQLAAAMPLGPRAWGKFADAMENLVGAPDGEVLEAVVPGEGANAVSVTGLDMYL